MIGIGLGVAFLAGIGLGSTGILVVAAAATLLWAVGQAKWPVFVLAIALALIGAWRAPAPSISQFQLTNENAVRLTAIVDSYPVTTVNGQRFDIRTDPAFESVDTRFCVVSRSVAPIDMGSTIRLDGMVTPIDDMAHDLQGALTARGCAGSIESSEVVTLRGPSLVQSAINANRDRISGVFQRAAPGDTGALMTGLVTGDDSMLSFTAKSAFLATGTTHITAVSGANFALIALIATTASRGSGMRRRLPWIAATASVIWVYAMLVGFPPSALRAALMATFALFSIRVGRRPDFVSLLVVSCALQIALRPSDLQSLSFQLSFVATLALVLVFSGQEFGPRRLPIAIVMTAFAAHLATVPVLAYRLGELAPATIPANVLISPLTMIGFTLSAIAAVLGLASETAGVAAAIPAAMVSGIIVAIVTNAAELLPGRASTGAASEGSLVALTAVCWSLVLLMSADARTAIARARGSVLTGSMPARLALLGASGIAVLVYAFGSMVR